MKIDNKYLEFLNDRRTNRPLKIPRYLSKELLKDRQLLKSLCVYLELKPLFYDSRFHNGYKRRRTLAKYLCMSFTAFNYKLKRLEKYGFIKFDSRGDLILCSWDEFFTILGHRKTDNRKYRFYKLKNIYPNSEYLIRYYAIKENFARQREIIDKKLYRQHFIESKQMDLMKEVDKILKDNSIAILDRQRAVNILTDRINEISSEDVENDKTFRKYKKKGVIDDLYIKGCANWFKEIARFNSFPSINFDISISCKKMAEIFGLSSAGSGHYWQQVMKGHFFDVERRVIYTHNAKFNEVMHAHQTDNLVGHYFYGNKSKLFRRLNNRINLRPLQEY